MRSMNDIWDEQQTFDATFVFLAALPFFVVAVAFIGDWIRSGFASRKHSSRGPGR